MQRLREESQKSTDKSVGATDTEFYFAALASSIAQMAPGRMYIDAR
jgi:hypothetical protein